MSEQTDTASQFLVRSKSVCSSPPSPTGTNHSIESSKNDRIEATFSVSAFPLFVPAFSPLIDQPAQRISAVPANETSAGNVSLYSFCWVQRAESREIRENDYYSKMARLHGKRGVWFKQTEREQEVTGFSGTCNDYDRESPIFAR